MTMLRDKAQQSQATKKLYNNKRAKASSMAERVIDALGLEKLLPNYNSTQMELSKILFFLISTIGVVVHGSLNQLFSDPAIARTAGFCRATLYNALKHQGIDWSGLFSRIAQKVARLFFHGKEVWFVVDDTILLRDSSKYVELLARVYDHNEKTYHQGFTILVLGVTDGEHIIPISFSLLASANPESLIKPKKEDKNRNPHSVKGQCKAGKNRKQACQPKLDVLMGMLKHAKSTIGKSLKVKGLLIDSWFSAPAQIKRFLDIGLEVITQLKFNNTKFTTEDGQVITVKSEGAKISRALKQGNHFGSIAKEISVKCNNGVKGKIIFSQNWKENAKKKPYIALFCTETKYSGSEIRRLYKYRWHIETMFKRLKSLLDVQKGNTTRIFESNVACISIAFIRYVVIMYAQRCINLKIKNNKRKLSFDEVKCLFALEKRHTESVEDLVFSLDSQTQFKGHCIDLIDSILNTCETPEEYRVALFKFKDDAEEQYQRNILQLLSGISPETRKRLCSYVVHGSIVYEAEF